MIQRIDLLPPSYAARRRDRRNRSYVILAGLGVFVLLLGWFFLLKMQVSDARSELATVVQENDRLQAEIDALERFALLDAEVKAKKTALQTVFAGDIDWPAIMTEIAMVVPGEVWLDSISASAGATEGAAPVASETNAIRLSRQLPVGRIKFTGNSASCMPGVAKWLIRLATVDEFEAAWIGSASEADSRPGCEPPVLYDSTLELNKKALSHRFEGDFE